MSDGAIKLVYLLRRRPELSRAAFQDYWLRRHGPLVAERAKAIGVSRYVQSHAVESAFSQAVAGPRGAAVGDFDGSAEAWWDIEALASAAAGSGYREASRALLEDEAAFIDLARSVVLVCRDHVLVADGEPCRAEA